MAEREKLIELKDLQITFGSGKKKFVAVDHVNFDIYKGETFSLVGESGSGKTTIGRAICRINPTSGGDIFFKGQKINGKISKELDREVIRKVQMIFQDPMASLNERAKVEYIVAEGLLNHHLYKDQDDLLVDLPQAVGCLHAVDARQLDVHEHDVIVGTVMFQKRRRIPEGRGLQRDIPLCRVAGKAFFQMFQLSGAVLHDRTAQHPVLPFTKTFRNQYSAICENWQQLPLHTINNHQLSWWLFLHFCRFVSIGKQLKVFHAPRVRPFPYCKNQNTFNIQSKNKAMC